MAKIEYRIVVDANGNATVTTEVRETDDTDQITFTSNRTDTAIRYPKDSQFTDPGSPLPNEIFLVGMKAGPFAPKNRHSAAPPRNLPGIGMRRLYHFDCGAENTSLITHAKDFVPWGGGGGPGGGGQDFP